MSFGIQRTAGSQLRNNPRSMKKKSIPGRFHWVSYHLHDKIAFSYPSHDRQFYKSRIIISGRITRVMMGPNIGTTITGWLISILGFKVKFNTLFIPLFAFGIPMFFTNKGTNSALIFNNVSSLEKIEDQNLKVNESILGLT